jgi:hypothetical protein
VFVVVGGGVGVVGDDPLQADRLPATTASTKIETRRLNPFISDLLVTPAPPNSRKETVGARSRLQQV